MDRGFFRSAPKVGTWIKGVYEKDYLLKEYPYGECALLYSKKAVKCLKSLVAKYKSEKATKVKSNAGKVCTTYMFKLRAHHVQFLYHVLLHEGPGGVIRESQRETKCRKRETKCRKSE